MKDVSFNRVGKLFTVVFIFLFMINDFLDKANYTNILSKDTTDALFALGHNIHYLSSAIILAGCIIALSILFTDHKKN